MKTVFRKPIVLLLCAVIALSALLCACEQNEENFPVPLSDTDKSALELCTTKYLESDLDAIYQSMADGDTVQELDKAYPIECLRKTDSGYTVIYKGKHRVEALRFDKNGKWQDATRLNCIYRMTDSRGKFDALKIGDSIVEVQKVDPTCYFAFMLTDTGEPLETYHYTEDGYYTHITYERGGDSFAIKSMDSGIM